MAYKQLSEDEALSLAGTTDERTGVKLPDLLRTFWAPAYLRMAHRLMGLGLTDLAVLEIDPTDVGTPPGIGVLPGVCNIGGTVFEYAGSNGAAVIQGLADGDTLVWAYDNAGTLGFDSGASWPGTSHWKLARVSVAGGEITDILPMRAANMSG